MSELELAINCIIVIPMIAFAYYTRKTEDDLRDTIDDLEHRLRVKSDKLDKLKGQFIGTKELRRRLLEYERN